ncbi:MAG: CDGSH iron-sulfur domain-containing protein [Cyclobacteriaceae bacterium]|nr:CDGSH iron-sulfur domain-containing protein [Cyclobacteriaceae bacterium]
MSNPKIPQKQPYVEQIEPGNYAWCSCGLSEKQPYCDGSHKATDHTPIVCTITEAQTVAWCGCKHSGNAPYCDGSHSRL